ncbi:GNAT family N-acetyltransferase [Nesterenkonia muleiensis]|uniref:GNAT family N-acetyltransferase n=1 Tax=Nesterenkonia muleiensis TaxID=2282648 RepID=UPI000E75C70D|nr:GNAT family N-acetyltransferase [Nesterenkonia muleiensis]
MLPTAPNGQPTLLLDSGLSVRPWTEGDDLRLLEVWGDPENSMHHQDRSLLRPSSNAPWSRCIVAEASGVPVAAATMFRSSLHPDRLSFYVEVAPEHRRRGVAAQLLQILEAEVPNCDVQSLKARCAKGSAAQCFLKDNGFRKVQHSREVIIHPDSLPVPDVENLPIDLEEIATGSVELTELVADFYNTVHDWDRAEMTLGRAQQMLLSAESGATGAVVLRSTAAADSADEEASGPILAFAISYTPERTDAPADVLMGWDPKLDQEHAEQAVMQLLGLVAARYPVSVEVDDSMAPLKRITDVLGEQDAAEIDFEALIYVRDTP